MPLPFVTTSGTRWRSGPARPVCTSARGSARSSFLRDTMECEFNGPAFGTVANLSVIKIKQGQCTVARYEELFPGKSEQLTQYT